MNKLRIILIFVLLNVSLFINSLVLAQDGSHPIEQMLIEMSEDIKSGEKAALFRVVEQMSECSAFFAEFSAATGQLGISTAEERDGLKTMQGQISNVAALLWLLHSPTAIDDVSTLVEDSREDQSILIRANGFDSLEFVSLYDRCLHTYYVANHLALEGKSAIE